MSNEKRVPAIAVPELSAVAWVIPGDDNAKDNGHLDAMAWQQGEFSRPLYDQAALNEMYLRGRTESVKADLPEEK